MIARITYVMTTRQLKTNTPSARHHLRSRRVYLFISKLAKVVNSVDHMEFYWYEPELEGDWLDRFVRQLIMVIIGETVCMEAKLHGYKCNASDCIPVHHTRWAMRELEQDKV